jgi:hypothetical protein
VKFEHLLLKELDLNSPIKFKLHLDNLCFTLSFAVCILSTHSVYCTMEFIAVLVKILISLLMVSAQKKSEDLRISRINGNIFRNLTTQQEFVDHIVTSQLDNSPLIRMFYRGIREVYSRLISGTGERHNNERFQKQIPPSARFPCRVDGFKSSKVPKSVHQLRPGGKFNQTESHFGFEYKTFALC